MDTYSLDIIPQRITKELLLSRNPAEAYYEFYLGVPVKRGLFISPRCIRIDHTPTCSFYKNSSGGLVYKDFAGPTFNSFVDVVMYLNNCGYGKALKIIANDFGIVEFPKMKKNICERQYSGTVITNTEKSKIQVEVKSYSDKELQWWNSFGVSIKTLSKFKVFSIKSVFLNGNYFTSFTDTTPIFGYYGGNNSDGDELWRLYFPTKRKYRFLSNWSSSQWQGLKQLPKSGNHCIISKSMKDLMVLYEFGFISVAPSSENIVATSTRYEKLKMKYNNNIIVFFDNDLPGVKGAKKYKKEFPDCRCIFLKRKYSKDISDLYKKISNTQFWIVVEELQNIINNLEIKNTKHFYIF